MSAQGAPKDADTRRHPNVGASKWNEKSPRNPRQFVQNLVTFKDQR
jgi:hypothetical protein